MRGVPSMSSPSTAVAHARSKSARALIAPVNPSPIAREQLRRPRRLPEATHVREVLPGEARSVLCATSAARALVVGGRVA